MGRKKLNFSRTDFKKSDAQSAGFKTKGAALKFFKHTPKNSCPILNPLNIREKLKRAKKRRQNPPTLWRKNATQKLLKNVPNLEWRILESHYETVSMGTVKKNCPVG